MFKLSIKSLLARKLRLLLMVFAIVLGVSFVVASFVISDSLRVSSTKPYIRFYERDDATGEYQAINLDVAAL